MVKALIFDLQGTLIENGVYPSPLKQTKHFLRISTPYHEYVPAFESIFMTKRYETLNDAFAQICADMRLRVPGFVAEKFVGMWNKNKLLSKPYFDTIGFLQANKGKYKLILIANIDCFSKDIITKYELDKYFDDIILSCNTGKLKNNPHFYDESFEKLGLTQNDVLLIGDSIESDIEPALKAGMRAILMDRNDTREYDNKINNLTMLQELLENEDSITME